MLKTIVLKTPQNTPWRQLMQKRKPYIDVYNVNTQDSLDRT